MKNNIVGQKELINDLKKIFTIFKTSNGVIRPHFFLTGASGTGKSFIVRSLAENLELSFLDMNAAALTKEGVSGNSLSKALTPLANNQDKPTVIFVDEFDKLFIAGNSNDQKAHESTTGVQNEFLKAIEGPYATVFGDYGKYFQVSVQKCLYVFAGAFNGEKDITIDKLRDIGIKTEFLGRVGLVYNTKELTVDDLFDILENSILLDHYLKLFEDVDREKIIYQLKAYIQKNFENNTLGARMINTMIHQFFIKGSLEEKQVEAITFQKKLKFGSDD